MNGNFFCTNLIVPKRLLLGCSKFNLKISKGEQKVFLSSCKFVGKMEIKTFDKFVARFSFASASLKWERK